MKGRKAAARVGVAATTVRQTGPMTDSCATSRVTLVTTLVAALVAVLLGGCATYRVESAWVTAGSPPSAVQSSSAYREPPLRVEIERLGNGRREAHQIDGGRLVSPGVRATPAAQQARISGGPLRGALLQGVVQPDDAGGWKISLISLHWFNNWSNGWTDATFVVDGSLDLRRSASAWHLLVRSAPEIDGPSAVTIRYYNDYLGGTEALDQFTDRWNRIEAYAKFLHSRYGNIWPASTRNLERILFPEIYGYSTPPAPDHASVEGSGVRWNSDYTRALFPKELRPIRDSGTMLRDWEESRGLWQLAFSWRGIWAKAIETDLFRLVKH